MLARIGAIERCRAFGSFARWNDEAVERWCGGAVEPWLG